QDQTLVKQWTGDKLDWMRCLALDPRIHPYQFEVGFAIIQHANSKTRKAILSDEVIQEATNISRPHILRARMRLRDTGWLLWRRTGKANVYEPRFDKINQLMDRRIFLREARRERQKRSPLDARDISQK